MTLTVQKNSNRVGACGVLKCVCVCVCVRDTCGSMLGLTHIPLVDTFLVDVSPSMLVVNSSWFTLALATQSTAQESHTSCDMSSAHSQACAIQHLGSHNAYPA
eukprot:2462084-Amphidinium_carterae.1